MPQQPVPMTLVMQRGPHPSRSFSLEKDQLVLGRDASVDIVIDDREVSRFHARLTRRGSQWIVEDIGSSNGTFVNGQRISGPVVLAPGSQLGLGPDVVLGVQSAAPAYAAAPQPRGGGGGLGWGIIGAVAVLAALLLIGGGAAVYFLLLNPPAFSLPSLELSGMAAPAEGPAVTIQEPAPGTRVGAGATMLVFATARDAQKVTRLDLWINDTLVTQQASPAPEGVTPLSLVYRWTPTEAGLHYLMVRAYDSGGVTGESPLVAVTVSSDPAPPEQALYVTQPGDTVDSLAAQMGVTVQDVQAANPAMGAQIAPGQVVALPAPKSADVTVGGAAPAPPPAKAGGAASAGGAAGAAGAGPAAFGPPPPPPPNASLIAPTLIGLQAVDCQVTVAWQDNSVGEDGFGVVRATLGQPGFTLLKPMIGKLEGTGKSQQFVDIVPGPGSYIYTVVAGTAAGAQARSNPHTIVVPATAACVEPPRYKQVVFQPLQVQAGKYSSLDLYFDVGNHIYRRVPAKGRLTAGDWSGNQQTVPAPVYLKPGDPLVLTVTGEGRAGKGSHALGSFSRSFTPAELTADRQWHDTVAVTGFDVTYRLWVENVVWGQGTNNQMPPPSNLRLATTAGELDVVPGCAPGKCDPNAARSLVWDWAGDPAQAEGYILLRTYNCGGKETHSTDVIVGGTKKARIMAAGSEPAGCAASYQVSAFGPAGVSPPSTPWNVPAAPVNAVADVVVAFEKFGVNGLAGNEVVQVAFHANDQSVKSASVVAQDKLLDMWHQFLDGKAPNNQIAGLPLAAGDSLQIGFLARVGDRTCAAQEILSLKPGETWDQYIGHEVTMKSLDGKCEAVARIGQSSHPLSAADEDPPKVSAEIEVQEGWVVGHDAYASIINLGPDELTDQHHIRVEGWWLQFEREPGTVWEKVDELLVSQQTEAWPVGSDHLVLKVGSTDPIHYLKETTKKETSLQFKVSVEAVDFEDPHSWGNVGYFSIGKNPVGIGCQRNEDCESEYCADGQICAPKKGAGAGGNYCHHDNQCASDLCLCPDGWESGDKGYCKGWQQFNSLVGNAGRCLAQFEDGAKCDKDEECVSGSCADGKICAPKDGTGESGDYCHHDNQCTSGLCLCPNGWEGGSGFCKGWQDFTATGSHGTCSETLSNGATCTDNQDCTSGYCADGQKCAPKDGTGDEGDYCHHDNQCASGMCDCPGEDMRVMGGKSFCPDWQSFTTTQHGVCLALNENGDGCTRNEQCESGYCADGKKCAPKDGTGGEGDYCHHNNHCQTRVCDCPDGTDWLGFCNGWEKFTATNHATCQVY